MALRNAPVEIVGYDPSWPALFEEERERLRSLLPGAEIHHIGSTAIPGMPAKPVIDIMALVEDLDAPVARLVEHGYDYPPDFNASLTHRRWLCRPSAAHRTHHLHLVDERAELDRRLRFRDDREAYTDSKRAFVERVAR